VGLRGEALQLRDALERLIADAANSAAPHGCEAWAPPAALALGTLARASYFASFPHWLTLAAHLHEDPESLRQVAESSDPVAVAREACAPADAALSPAVCYHVYAALAGRALESSAFVTVQGTCWRHEGDRLSPLARGWAFTMREGVCVADADVTEEFRQRGIARARVLAGALGLNARLEEATDPFFAPTARGRMLLQRLKGLKQELLLPVGDECIAAASFNQHEYFFGDAFDIRLGDGTPAHSACVAYGVDRWLLAVLAAHGTDPRGWPSFSTDLLREVSV
jgi:seryl-tRNA synthetase